MDEIPFRERAQTQEQNGLSVSVAVPTRREASEIYGVDLALHDIQPIWVDVENGTEFPMWLLPVGIDPAFYSASETAYVFRRTLSSNDSRSLDKHVQRLAFRNPVRPQSKSSGFVLVNRDEGFKAVDIDVVSRQGANSFTFIVVDPSFKGDFTLVDFASLYSASDWTDLEDESALRKTLEALPCCTTNREGTEQGDPLNLVLIGDANDIFAAFVRRGWHGTEILWSEAIRRTVTSFLEGSRYRYSPVSPLYVYARQQDIALQKARGTIHERNHLRLWLSPFRFRGEPVWVGQISRDIGVKFTLKSPTISTHVIDPDVDEARRYLVEDLAYSQAMARFGYVEGVGKSERASPRFNLVGDPFYTDGLRAVMFFEPRPFSLGDIQMISGWERPDTSATPQREGTPDASR